MIEVPLRLAAALVLRSEHTAFGPTDKGTAAQQCVLAMADALDRRAPYWREEVWPKRRK